MLEQIDARRIAVIKPSALGDVVQALPLLPILRKRFPASSISWVIQRELQELVVGHPCIDDVICIDRRPTWTSAFKSLAEMRQRQFDLVVDLQGLLRSAVLTWASVAKYRVGLETAREGAGYATNHTIPATHRDVPAHARYWRVAEVLGLGHLPREVWLTVSPANVTQAEHWVDSLSGPVFGVQWGAKWITKRWPIERFAELLTRAGQFWQGSVVIVGGPGDREPCHLLQQHLEAQLGPQRVLNLTGRTSLKELACVLARIDYMVSNDSGPMHLAAELGTPTLGIFTCTNSLRSGPPGDRHVMVSTTVACAGSYRKQCPHTGTAHMQCHAELTTDRVWHALRQLVEQNPVSGCVMQISGQPLIPLRLAG